MTRPRQPVAPARSGLAEAEALVVAAGRGAHDMERRWFPFVRVDNREEFFLPPFAAREGATEAELLEIAAAHTRRFLPSGAGRITKIAAGRIAFRLGDE